MAEILIKAVDAVHSDPAKDERGSYKRGFPVSVKPDGWTWGSDEGLPKFQLLKIPGVTVAQLLQYVQSYQRVIQFVVVNQDLAADGFRIRIEAANPSVSGKGNVTQLEVQNFIENWGGSIFSFAANAVTFDILIFNSIKSNGFWNRNVSQVVFTELQYTQAGGIHRVQADYSATGVNAKIVEDQVKQRGASVVSHLNSVIVFDITRVLVRDKFERTVKEKVERGLVRRKFYFQNSDMDALFFGGSAQATKTLVEVQAFIRDKQND